ncbi:hypothetical protein RRG08_045370 [Elysia crispata]|uniref:Uncharacterized protein n=1 Tax=Elysia crispata TaxID=231223 RepID=A0AAE1CVD2_9GAST|nr:hypothetical protein RRG08_045370 [Elysia crispata]
MTGPDHKQLDNMADQIGSHRADWARPVNNLGDSFRRCEITSSLKWRLSLFRANPVLPRDFQSSDFHLSENYAPGFSNLAKTKYHPVQASEINQADLKGDVMALLQSFSECILKDACQARDRAEVFRRICAQATKKPDRIQQLISKALNKLQAMRLAACDSRSFCRVVLLQQLASGFRRRQQTVDHLSRRGANPVLCWCGPQLPGL